MVSRNVNNFIEDVEKLFPDKYLFITNRSYDEQFDLYKKGREVLFTRDNSLLLGHKFNIIGDKIIDKSKVVTYALPEQSFHCFGGAVDVISKKDGYNVSRNYYLESGLVELAKKHNLSWGGEWKNWQDIYHFEDLTVELPKKSIWSNQCKYGYSANFLTFDKIIYIVILFGALCGLIKK